MEWKDSFHKLWIYEWTLLPFQGSREKTEKREKKTKEKNLYLILSAGNIAGILNCYLVRTY